MKLWAYQDYPVVHWKGPGGAECYVVEDNDGKCLLLRVRDGWPTGGEFNYDHLLGRSMLVPVQQWPEWFKKMNYAFIDEGL